jgi:hypothetical protein
MESIHASVSKELNLMHAGVLAGGDSQSGVGCDFESATCNTTGFCRGSRSDFVVRGFVFDAIMTGFVGDAAVGVAPSEPASKRRLTPRVSIE